MQALMEFAFMEITHQAGNSAREKGQPIELVEIAVKSIECLSFRVNAVINPAYEWVAESLSR